MLQEVIRWCHQGGGIPQMSPRMGCCYSVSSEIGASSALGHVYVGEGRVPEK